MPSPIVHHLSEREVIIGFDPSGEYMLTGRTSTKFGSDIHELYRLRWDRDRCAFIRSRRHPKIRSSKVGAFFSEDFFTGFDWWEDRDAPAADVSSVTHVKRYVSVYTSALKKLAQAAAKASDDDQLIAFTVDETGVHVRTLGRLGFTCSLEITHKYFDTGLGSVVVYAHALKQSLKEAGTSPRVAVEYAGEQRDRVLRLGATLLWTVDRHVDATVHETPVYGRWPIAEAIRRTLPFASTDKNRANLTQLLIEPYADGVRITGANGVVMHCEVVSCPDSPPFPRVVYLPTALASKLPKKEKTVGFAFDSADRVHVQLADYSARIGACSAFPPAYTVIANALKRAADVVCLGDGASHKFRDAVKVATEHECVNVRLSDDRVLVWDDDSIGPANTAVALDRHWVLLEDPRTSVEPKAYRRAVYIVTEQLQDALASLHGALTLTVSRDGDDPLILQTETQTHVLMPARRD